MPPVKLASASEPVERALTAIGDGRTVRLVERPAGPAGGSLVMAAQLATPATLELMAQKGEGELSVALTPERWEELGLGAERSFDARGGEPPGAGRRTRAVRVAIDPTKGARDIVTPGRMPSLRSRPGGVLEHPGEAEAAVDLARLAGCLPAGLICALQGGEEGLPTVSIAELVEYRRRRECSVERVVTTAMPTRFGRFTAVGYRSQLDGQHHMALVKGDVGGADDVLVRFHSECLAGDVFHSLHCGCRRHLAGAMSMIEEAGSGVVLYLSRERPATRLRDLGDGSSRESQGDLRSGYLGTEILLDLGLSSIRLLTSEPGDAAAVEGFGLSVTGALDIASPRC